MDIQAWVGLDDRERERVTTAIAAQVGGWLRTVRAGPIPLALFEVRGHELVLVPGGRVTLGWDGGPLAIEEQALDEWEAESEEEASFADYLRYFLGPSRTVVLEPFLLETVPTPVADLFDPYDVENPEDEVRARIAADGFRLPSGDEWEHAARAGASTMFRWGDAWPPGIPHGRETTFRAHHGPNNLGLRFLTDPYQSEVVHERDQFRGGDGGSAICGGRPWPEPWYSFALAFRWPREAWADCVVESLETAFVRRALGPVDHRG